MIKGGSARRAAAAPQDAGGAVPGSTKVSRYVQVGMGTFMRVVSDGFAQPLPALTDFPVNVGTGNVGMTPVGVYAGKVDTEPAWLMVVGGQA